MFDEHKMFSPPAPNIIIPIIRWIIQGTSSKWTLGQMIKKEPTSYFAIFLISCFKKVDGVAPLMTDPTPANSTM